ncbi:ATP-citrate synthase [Mycena sanguinolenta]|uniref:ATP citrate synthase n=1 Tax=Mycena sanguinolenta TaxID=230812 RepID=A0A8H6Z2G6_9AGAR|nr:ATP-citrate synthase [Mycena sanguinolenta]
MFDFDYSRRKTPSIAAMIYPFGGHHIQKFYWRTKETLLPVYTSVDEAVAKHPDADVMVNFASSRSLYSSTLEILKFSSQIRSIAIIVEGVPERHARELLWLVKEAGVLVIGSATVGGIKPGCFRIGNSGGMMDNITASKLYRAGSVGYVSKSGGMSNELNNILSLTTNGTYESIVIGGDRYPGLTFIDHLLRYEADPQCTMLVLLGEMFDLEVQFGHAGSMADSEMETADRNKVIRVVGFVVPETFKELLRALKETYENLVKKGVILPMAEMDYKWAQELGLIRKLAAFISSIGDERGQELLYAKMRISDVFKEDIGLGGVVSLLWLKHRLPVWATKFIEMVLMLTTNHNSAVSGAMNTIVASCTGQDLILSLAWGC